MTFEPTDESLCFLRGALEWMTEAKSINVSYIIDLKEHVIAKRGNCSEEIAGRWKIKAWVKQISLQDVICKLKFRVEKHCLVKHLAFLKTFAINI